MLSGQVADGITTPLVGFYSDKTNTKLGKRTPWYLFGSIFVLPTFLAIFIYPEFGDNENLKIAYYITLPALFNVGKL
jgi:GPH family glycoside/pentoside/hexuronide:cation symporter